MKLTTGVDDFKELIEKAYTYVDKSLFIDDVYENPLKIQLITRPRRFGKTLNMSMLYHFFDQAQQNRHLFKGLAIEERPCFEACGSRPVIFLSFKELKGGDFKTFLGLFSSMIAFLYQRHTYLLKTLSKADQENFERLVAQRGDKAHLMGAIAQLMHWLEQHHGKKVLLLIDEYDSPIDEAYRTGYYEPVITFMRTTLGSALKGNTALYKGVLTGILRISKESIFSDLKNLRVYTVLDQLFDQCFGFTEMEVTALLEEAGRKNKLEAVRRWYNGYNVGKAVVYNPWSVISFLDDPDGKCQAYWVNTSSNNLIHQLLTSADADVQETLTELINGETVDTPIYSQTTLRDLDEAALWSLLLYSGYLTSAGEDLRGNRYYYALRIPNEEVRLLYQDIFMRWLNVHVGTKKMNKMLAALTEGNLELFEFHFQEMVLSMLSYFDTSRHATERFYHAFVLGLLANLDYRYHIRSNRESGYGRYNLMMIPRDVKERGVIMEFKVAESEAAMDSVANAALAQIDGKQYVTELEARGVTAYLKIGIAFFGKQVKVVGT